MRKWFYKFLQDFAYDDNEFHTMYWALEQFIAHSIVHI